jgi:hypothetical protein
MASKAMKAMKTMKAMNKTSPGVIEWQKHWRAQHTGKFLNWTLVGIKYDGKPNGWVTETWNATGTKEAMMAAMGAAKKGTMVAKKAMKTTKGAMMAKKAMKATKGAMKVKK